MSADPIRINPATTPPGVTGATPPPAAAPRPAVDGPGFDQLLKQRLSAADTPLRLSGHAMERLQQRGIPVDSTAFVVSVQNRTVITAVGADNMRDRVFTNIDSAVIN